MSRFELHIVELSEELSAVCFRDAFERRNAFINSDASTRVWYRK